MACNDRRLGVVDEEKQRQGTVVMMMTVVYDVGEAEDSEGHTDVYEGLGVAENDWR